MRGVVLGSVNAHVAGEEGMVLAGFADGLAGVGVADEVICRERRSSLGIIEAGGGGESL